MKNKLVFAGLLIGVLTIGVIVGGCATTGTGSSVEPTKFEGVWKSEEMVYTFTGNKVSYKDPSRSRPGTFSFTDTTITFIPPPNTWTGWTQGYTMVEGKLTLTNDIQITGNGFVPVGEFIKQ